MEREVRRESKRAAAAAKLAAKEAKLEAERLAQEEEDKLVEGLDELEMVLMRQTLRAKVGGLLWRCWPRVHRGGKGVLIRCLP